jgi:hypothetical protein
MPISSSTTHGKLYQDALRLEEKYVGLVFELRHLVDKYDLDELQKNPMKLLDKLEALLQKYSMPEVKDE